MSIAYSYQKTADGRPIICAHCNSVAPTALLHDSDDISGKSYYCELCTETAFRDIHYMSGDYLAPKLLAQTAHWLVRKLELPRIEGVEHTLVPTEELSALRVALTTLQNRYDRYVHDHRKQNTIAQIVLKIHKASSEDDEEVNKLFKQLWGECKKYEKDPYCGD